MSDENFPKKLKIESLSYAGKNQFFHLRRKHPSAHDVITIKMVYCGPYDSEHTQTGEMDLNLSQLKQLKNWVDFHIQDYEKNQRKIYLENFGLKNRISELESELELLKNEV
jgi:hypothetical protein